LLLTCIPITSSVPVRLGRPSRVRRSRESPARFAAAREFYFNTLVRDLGDLAAGSEVIPPTLLVRDEMTLDLGGRAIVLRTWPVAHTDNDLTVFDQEYRHPLGVRSVVRATHSGGGRQHYRLHRRAS
jgi:hypothetical protein